MEFDDSLLNTGNDQGGSQLKLVSLSFALSHLLPGRRFFGMDCAEAALPQTRRFALEGLLTQEDQATHYSTAFGIIEAELGFIYDLFFTKHQRLFKLELFFHALVILKIIFALLLGIFLLGYFPTIMTPDPIIEVSTTRVDVIVTFLIMVALLLLETIQVILYYTSDWAFVSLSLSYTDTRRRSRLTSCIKHFRMILIYTSKKLFGKITNLFGYWQNQMGQSSLIE